MSPRFTLTLFTKNKDNWRNCDIWIKHDNRNYTATLVGLFVAHVFCFVFCFIKGTLKCSLRSSFYGANSQYILLQHRRKLDITTMPENVSLLKALPNTTHALFLRYLKKGRIAMFGPTFENRKRRESLYFFRRLSVPWLSSRHKKDHLKNPL